MDFCNDKTPHAPHAWGTDFNPCPGIAGVCIREGDHLCRINGPCNGVPRETPSTGVVKNKTTEENKEFWAHCEKMCEEVRHWPKWMGGEGVPKEPDQTLVRLIESIIYRRALEGKLMGYTLETAQEIAAMVQLQGGKL